LYNRELAYTITEKYHCGQKIVLSLPFPRTIRKGNDLAGGKSILPSKRRITRELPCGHNGILELNIFPYLAFQ
jgi:hypothetical protein